MTTEPSTSPAGEAPKKEKKKPENLVIPPKKPKLSKAERRALQEQQRAAKAAGGQQQGGDAKQQQQQQANKQQQPQQQQHQSGGKKPAADIEATRSKDEDDLDTEAQSQADRKTISLFSHLPPYQDPKLIVKTGPTLQPLVTPGGNSSSGGAGASNAELHPAVIHLGHQYACGHIRGGNARCRAMLQVFHQVISDFQPPTGDPTVDLRHVLDQQVLKPSFQYWTESCRPHSVTMGNAFTFLKTAVASLDRDLPNDQMVEMLQETIQAYIRERIDYAKQAIAQQPALQLNPSGGSGHNMQPLKPQVFLTYGHSEAIEAIFLRMVEDNTTSCPFRVILVDSRPLLEGKQLLQKLRAANIDCTYILLNALTYVMNDVTKVYLGASALMSDGGVLGRVGTACVALSAHMHHIPVLVCCESYKISNRVQLESITGNELGSPTQGVVELPGSSSSSNGQADDSHKSPFLKDWMEMDNLRLLNLLYDLTPSDFVSGIVTELGIIPPTSVAVLLREMNPQN